MIHFKCYIKYMAIEFIVLKKNCHAELNVGSMFLKPLGCIVTPGLYTFYTHFTVDFVRHTVMFETKMHLAAAHKAGLNI